MNVERPVLRSQRYKMNVERPVLRWRSTFGAAQDELERPVLRLWYPKMTRFTFRAPQDKRRTPRFTFEAPQERRESRLHRFRPASPQQTLGSHGGPPTERRTGRSHCLLAVAVVAFAEGPRARPSPRSITYVMRGNLCLAHRPAPRRTPAGPSPGHGSSSAQPSPAQLGAAAPRAREVLPLVGEGLSAQREPQTGPLSWRRLERAPSASHRQHAAKG